MFYSPMKLCNWFAYLVFFHSSNTIHDYSFSKKKEQLLNTKYIISEEFILKKRVKPDEISGNLHMFHTWF